MLLECRNYNNAYPTSCRPALDSWPPLVSWASKYVTECQDPAACLSQLQLTWIYLPRAAPRMYNLCCTLQNYNMLLTQASKLSRGFILLKQDIPHMRPKITKGSQILSKVRVIDSFLESVNTNAPTCTRTMTMVDIITKRASTVNPGLYQNHHLAGVLTDFLA